MSAHRRTTSEVRIEVNQEEGGGEEEESAKDGDRLQHSEDTDEIDLNEEDIDESDQLLGLVPENSFRGKLIQVSKN